MSRLLLALAVVIGAPLALVGYISLVEGGLHLLPGRAGGRARPWLWLLPAGFFLGVFLVYPTIHTLVLSFYGPSSRQPVGLSNFKFVFGNPGMLVALRNNGLWLVLFTAGTVIVGLLAAVLTDRVRYESVAKSVIFLPMAISFAAASVIWKFMYDFQPAGAEQTGTLNAVLTLIPGFQPRAWLINAPSNTLFLIVAGIWVWTGFCMVVLSAALKGLSGDVIEAARVDGATEWQVFWRVVLPLLWPTVAVISTIMLVYALKTFDVVYVMTSGNYNTQILAFSQYQQMFLNQDFGKASAIGVVLLVAVLPVLAFNLRRFRGQEAIR